MVGHVGVHGTDNTHIIDVSRSFCEEFANFSTALTGLLKPEGRPHGCAGFSFSAKTRRRKRFPMILVQHRFWIEGIDLRRSTVHEQMHNALCLGSKVRRFRR